MRGRGAGPQLGRQDSAVMESGTHEIEQRPVIMMIRRAKRRDILLPAISGLGQTPAPPGETGTTKNMHKEKISH